MKKLIETKKLLKQQLSKQSDDFSAAFDDEGSSLSFLRKYGFKKHPFHACWINKKKRIVVKYGYTLGPQPKKFSITTLKYKDISIQPMVNTTRVRLAKKILRKKMKLENYNIDNYDSHEGNIGWYRNRPVLFDW